IAIARSPDEPEKDHTTRIAYLPAFASKKSAKRPRSERSGASGLIVPLRRSGARAHAHHEAVEAELGDLLPGKRVAAEGCEVVVQLLEHRIGLHVLRVDFLRGSVAGLEHRLR